MKELSYSIFRSLSTASKVSKTDVDSITVNVLSKISNREMSGCVTIKIPQQVYVVNHSEKKQRIS